MSDPVKPIVIVEGEAAKETEVSYYELLARFVENAAPAFGLTGFSLLILSMRLWTEELMTVDRASTAKFLKALADYADPPEFMKRTKTKEELIERAEKARREAVVALSNALALHRAEPDGRPPQ